MADIVCTAFLFAVQPCKYTKTLKTSEIKRTNITKLGNIHFYRNNRILRHNQDIENIYWVNITFEYKKTMIKINLLLCTYQITIVSAQSYCVEKRDTCPIIQSHQPT